MAEHTPGPWVARQEFANRWRIESPKEGCVPLSVGLACTTILEVGVTDKDTEANAQLIAAAPDLLAACREAEKFIDAILSFYGQGLDVHNWHQNGDPEPLDNFIDENSTGDELRLLRAAIAKATAPA